jgi:cell wall-associated NlpC family hydrolase
MKDLSGRSAVLACALPLLCAATNAQAEDAADIGAKVVATALAEVTHHAAAYALSAEIRIPWRRGVHAKGEWKCNFFAMNVVYKAGGRVPAVAYGPGFRKLVSNYMYWRGRQLSRTGERKVAESHYPLARDLAAPRLFVKTIPLVQGGLEQLRPGDLIFMKPSDGGFHGHCLVYLGERDGRRLKCAYATEDGAVIRFYDVGEPLGYTIRRPQAGS